MTVSMIPSHLSRPLWRAAQILRLRPRTFKDRRVLAPPKCKYSYPRAVSPKEEAILRMASNLVKVPQISTIFLLFAFYSHRSEERRVGKESRSRWSPCD